ncbi:TonB-dependent receptor [uncultured Draconibacterium sp.]|uniref:TonB-dependent receptor n=1 Tax=uncultured Draconibacterium sp. TaxID=1573823 RepID=UPI0029C949E3|nr:TonB-dependent receptor [uncultured Draconibacterium sp.]
MKKLQNYISATILLLFACIFTVTAQNKITVKGIVLDAETNNPIVYANVALPDLGLGTTSNEKGEFTIKNVPTGTIQLAVTYLGYQKHIQNLHISEDVDLNILLYQQSLGLQEVIVTAESSSSTTSAATINQEAIDHIQATSLKELMQLIPGNLSENPDLSDPKKISIREVDTDVNSALGTAIIIDGIPLPNDGNMQQSIQTSGFASVAGSGTDLREISVDNIESITVDVGIPSVEYGNLTSGAVHIKTKTGVSPYIVKVQADPHTKQFDIGKGYLLQNDRGVLNINTGYTNSYQFIHKNTDEYKRIIASTKYSNTFFRNQNPLKIEAKVNYNQSLDGKKWDPDMKAEEEHYAKDRRFQSKLSALWSLNNSLLKSLSFDAGYTITDQKGFDKKLEASSFGPNVVISSLSEGEHEALYRASSYYSEVTYDGKPFDLYAKLKAKFTHQTDKTTGNLILGSEWRTTGNNGNGRIFDANNPPAGVDSRPRPFSDIPSLNQLSIFAEDKMIIDLGATRLNVMAGIRMDNIQPNGPFSSDGSLTFDPRLNIGYHIIDRNRDHFLSQLNFRLGYGRTTKAPTLTHLYPDIVYNDIKNFDYYPDLVVATTQIFEDTRNYDLNASRGRKYETGIDIKLGNTMSRITAFYEKYNGGFTLDRNYYLMPYRDYEQPPADVHPYFTEEGIFYPDPATGETVAVTYEMDEKWQNYSTYRNAQTRIKRGIEYTIDFGKVKALRTSFVLNGAWLQTESHTTNAPYWKEVPYTVYEGNSSKQQELLVKFPNRLGYGTVKERLNTNLSIITHIPEIKMLVTLTTQMVWHEKDWRKTYNDYKFYTLQELREYLDQPELFSSHNENYFYYYLPTSYQTYDGIEHAYSINDFENTLHQQAIDLNQQYRFEALTMSPLLLCNIRISKDIAQRFQLSFYANNFLNIRPWELNEREGQYIRRNNEPYFGAAIKMKL